MILSAIGTALPAVICFWIFGGFALRLGGALLVLVGAVGLATTGNANAILLVTLGVAAWWTGHLNYALRHGAWKSALARRATEGITATFAWPAGEDTIRRPEPGLATTAIREVDECAANARVAANAKDPDCHLRSRACHRPAGRWRRSPAD